MNARLCFAGKKSHKAKNSQSSSQNSATQAVEVSVHHLHRERIAIADAIVLHSASFVGCP